MKRGIRIAGILLLCAVFACGGYFAGHSVASLPETETIEPDYVDAFCAVVTKNDPDGSLMVEGLDVNNGNYQGEMVLGVKEAEMSWNNETISREDLREGDTIIVLHTGSVAEIHPPIVEDVTLIIKMQDVDQQ